MFLRPTWRHLGSDRARELLLLLSYRRRFVLGETNGDGLPQERSWPIDGGRSLGSEVVLLRTQAAPASALHALATIAMPAPLR